MLTGVSRPSRPIALFLSLVWIPQPHPSGTPGWPTRSASCRIPFARSSSRVIFSVAVLLFPLSSVRFTLTRPPRDLGSSDRALELRSALNHMIAHQHETPVLPIHRRLVLWRTSLKCWPGRLAILGRRYQKPVQNPLRVAYGNLGRRPQRANRQPGSANQSKRQDPCQEFSHKFLRSRSLGSARGRLPRTEHFLARYRPAIRSFAANAFSFRSRRRGAGQGNFRGSQTAKSSPGSPCAVTLPRRRHGRPSERVDPHARSPIRSIR
jgi:hypothetical protein